MCDSKFSSFSFMLIFPAPKMFVVVLLAVLQCATAALPVFRDQDPLVIAVNDMEGFLYEVPEYEDPQLLEHQLSSLNGGMPMFSLLDLAQKQAESKDKDSAQKTKIAESKKALEDIIYRLEATRSKLENGKSNIYIDLEKSIQGLKKLERSFRPDIRALFSSLRNLKPAATPRALPNILEIATTTRTPALFEKSSILEIPEKYEKKMIDVKIISKEKSILDQPQVDEEPAKESKIVDKLAEKDDKISELKPKNIEAPSDVSPEVSEVTTAPFETKEYQPRGRNIDEDDTPTLYQSKWSWNSSRRLS